MRNYHCIKMALMAAALSELLVNKFNLKIKARDRTVFFNRQIEKR